MWFKLVVCGIKSGPKTKTAEVFLQYRVNKCPFHVNDQSLATFCLPLGPESQQPKDRMAHEEYSFTLTQGDGTRVQGFCRRFLPPAPRVGSKLRYPQVLCLVCEPSWSTLFFKVLEVTEQLLRQTEVLLNMEQKELPANSYAGQFLSNLGAALADQPQLGAIIRVELPAVPTPLSLSPPKRIGTGSNSNEPLALTEDAVELQVPPNCGNGINNAGISLARLLWHVPVPAMLTLIASLLLERRVLVVGQSRDMVSAAVCAAAALLYPFKWHHIYLPLLPRSLKDYLTAPMPFLIGMPAQLLPTLKGIPMDEFTLIDLDLGRCEPAAGSMHDDAALLPWREQLEGALHAAFGLLRSPTEHESNPLITNIMQGYFLKLLGNYRAHIYPEGSGPGFTNGYTSAGPLLNNPHARSSPQGTCLQQENSSSSINSSPRSTTGGRHTPSSSMGQDESMKGHGYWFDYAGLVASHRLNDRARNFLKLLRQSQMFEVFVQERLQMFAQEGPEASDEPFEQLVTSYLDNRSKRLAARLGLGVQRGISRFTAFVKKHRRTGSQQHLPSFGGSSTHGSSTSFAGGLSGLTVSPENQRLKQLAATFASVVVGAGQMRRNLTEGSNLADLADSPSSSPASAHWHTVSSVDSLANRISTTLDPSAFFEDDDDLEDEAAAAAAAASGTGFVNGSGRMGSRSNSSSSLKDLASTAASWTAGESASLQRRSVPLASISSTTDQGPRLPLSPKSPRSLIELKGDAAALQRGQQQQQHLSASFLRQEQQLLQQRQQQHVPQQRRVSFTSINNQMQPSQAVAAGVQSHLQQQQQQQLPSQLQRPPLSAAAALAATAGPGSAAATAAATASHRTSQHLQMKAALASITPGPLPQPPQPKARTSSSSILTTAFIQHPGDGSSSSGSTRIQQLQQQQHDRGALSSVPLSRKISVVDAAAMAAAAGGNASWDPFAELVAERSQSIPVTALQMPQYSQPVSSSGGNSSSGSGSACGYNVATSSSSSSSSAVLVGTARQRGSSNSTDGFLDASSTQSVGGCSHTTMSCSGNGSGSKAHNSSSGGSGSGSCDPFPVVSAAAVFPPAVTAAQSAAGVSLSTPATAVHTCVGQHLEELLQLTSSNASLQSGSRTQSNTDGNNSGVGVVSNSSSSGGGSSKAGAAVRGGTAASTAGDPGLAQLEELLVGHLLD